MRADERKFCGLRVGWLVVAAAGVMWGAPLVAQVLHASGPLPSFEVATIKPMATLAPPPGEQIIHSESMRGPAPGGASRAPSDRMHWIMTTKILIESAYNLPPISQGR